MSSDATKRRARARDEVLPTLDLRSFIGGDFVPSSSGPSVTVADPMTGSTVAELPVPSPDDVGRALQAARNAFDSGPWPRMHPRDRARLLVDLASRIDEHREELALIEALDTGKRYAGVLGWDIPNAAEVFRYYAGWADKVTGSVVPAPNGVEMLTIREPVGVCVALPAWNFPFACTAWKLAPALAAGCTVILKAPERAPLSAQYLARLVKEVGFPPGTVSVLSGRAGDVGELLVSSPLVDRISFTGGYRSAQRIIELCSPNLTRLTLELGDKTPVVILPDADLDAAIPAAFSAMFGVAGQNCCAGSRTLIHESLKDDVLERFANAAERRRLGDPFDDETEQGPQIDLDHVATIKQHVDTALAQGATCVAGGAPSHGGRFFAPTILADVAPHMDIFRREVFGPVGAVTSYTTFDDAVRLANDRDFGLAAAVYTSDRALAARFEREVRTGTCWVNTYEYFDTLMPWGGRKLSGWGRELGADGLNEYLETKSVVRQIG